MVVAERAEHWFHRPLHLHLLCLLLPEPIIYEWPSSEHRVLWLLSTDSTRLFTDAGKCVILGLTGIYSLHLPQPQDGLDRILHTHSALNKPFLIAHIDILHTPLCSFSHTQRHIHMPVMGLKGGEMEGSFILIQQELTIELQVIVVKRLVGLMDGWTDRRMASSEGGYFH